jgi:hypothetical protein
LKQWPSKIKYEQGTNDFLISQTTFEDFIKINVIQNRTNIEEATETEWDYFSKQEVFHLNFNFLISGWMIVFQNLD